jgi:hypothetical protein
MTKVIKIFSKKLALSKLVHIFAPTHTKKTHITMTHKITAIAPTSYQLGSLMLFGMGFQT